MEFWNKSFEIPPKVGAPSCTAPPPSISKSQKFAQFVIHGWKSLVVRINLILTWIIFGDWWKPQNFWATTRLKPKLYHKVPDMWKAPYVWIINLMCPKRKTVLKLTLHLVCKAGWHVLGVQKKFWCGHYLIFNVWYLC